MLRIASLCFFLLLISPFVAAADAPVPATISQAVYAANNLPASAAKETLERVVATMAASSDCPAKALGDPEYVFGVTGDGNFDGRVDIADVVMALRRAVGLDTNRDGVDEKDLIIAAQMDVAPHFQLPTPGSEIPTFESEGNGIVDIGDAVVLLNMAVRKEVDQWPRRTAHVGFNEVHPVQGVALYLGVPWYVRTAGSNWTTNGGLFTTADNDSSVALALLYSSELPLAGEFATFSWQGPRFTPWVYVEVSDGSGFTTYVNICDLSLLIETVWQESSFGCSSEGGRG